MFAAAIAVASTLLVTPGDGSHAHVVGTAQVHYAPASDDDVRFAINAHDSRGRAAVYHHVAAQDITAWASGRIDCVSVADGAATVTMIVDRTSPVLDSWLGTRVGLSVDGHRVGSSGPMDPADLAPCTAPEPSMPVVAGGFRIAETP